MHFVSNSSREEQLTEICGFYSSQLLSSVENKKAPALKDFESKLETYQEQQAYDKILELLISIKQELTTLPTSH